MEKKGKDLENSIQSLEAKIVLTGKRRKKKKEEEFRAGQAGASRD